MKKLFTVLMAVLITAGIAVAGERVTRDKSELPQDARTVLDKHFPKVGINHIKVESGAFGSKDYEVILNDGTEIDFNKDGSIKEIDCGTTAVPATLVLKPIRDYVSANFAGAKIVGMEVKRGGYDIELSSGVDLKFDRAGNFKKIDY